MSDTPKIPSSQDPRDWSEPTPAPVDELKILCNSYAEDLEALRLTYVNAMAGRIATWFFNNYEDPVESCPYESAEGGYQYIWGECDTGEVVEEVLRDTITDDDPLFIEITDATIREIDDQGCGYVCVPLFGRDEPEDGPEDYDPEYDDDPDHAGA